MATPSEHFQPCLERECLTLARDPEVGTIPRFPRAPSRPQEEVTEQKGRREKRKLSADFPKRVTYSYPNLGEAEQGLGGNEAGEAKGGALGLEGSVPAVAREEGAPHGWQERMTTAHSFKMGTQTHLKASISAPCSRQGLSTLSLVGSFSLLALSSPTLLSPPAYPYFSVLRQPGFYDPGSSLLLFPTFI